MRCVAALALALAPLLFACGGSGSKPPADQTSGSRAPIVVREDGVGPIDASTTATESAIRALFPGYDVKIDNTLGVPDVLVSGDGEVQLIVSGHESGAVMSVRVMSKRVTSEAGWRVGDKITDASRFGVCECMGDGLTCFAKQSHVGAVLDEDCMGKMEQAAMAGKPASSAYADIFAGDPAALASLAGHTIRMLLWRSGTHEASDDPPPPPEE